MTSSRLFLVLSVVLVIAAILVAVPSIADRNWVVAIMAVPLLIVDAVCLRASRRRTGIR